MSARRRRALELMEKLKGFDIDRLARETAEMRAEMARLRKHRNDLAGKLRRERYAQEMEAVPYVASFVDSMQTQIRAIEKKMAEIEPLLAKQEAKMRELYREQKVFESVRLKNLRDEQAALARREAAELEEITIQRWNRYN